VIPSGTVTLLFSDIEGSTRLWEDEPASMAVALRRHDDLLRSAVEEAGGYVFKMVGDALCAAFAMATSAIEAAERAQRQLDIEPWPEGLALRVRMAIHTGECEERDGDYFGPVVNRVARLQAVAHGAQVVLSRATADLARDQLPPGVVLRDLGTHRLKDLGRPENVFQLAFDGLPADFPPLKSLGSPELRNNLPQLVSSFVGRDTELDGVRRLVQESRMVTLTGPGGSGKTRLALQVAAELVDGTGDGVWLVELASLRDPDMVPVTVAGVLGVEELSGRSPTDVLLEALADRAVLIVLDNCEHLIDACAKLADLVVRTCPHVHLLATSRESLDIDGETVFQVPSLALAPEDATDASELAQSESVRLFVERARSRATAFELDDGNIRTVASICRRLDGMPLAIELAVARLRSLSLAHLHDRLDERFRLLTGGSRSALPRQQTLRATVDWSYDLLNPSEQTVLERLSVFAGGFTLDAAEVVCSGRNATEKMVIDLLTSLVDKSLLLVDTSGSATRFRLLETIREYGSERLMQEGAAEIADVRRRHAEVFLALAEEAAADQHGPAQAQRLVQLETERDNLRVAAAHLLPAPSGAGRALRLGTALSWFWLARAHYGEGIDTLEAALDRPEAGGVPVERIRALTALGRLHVRHGDLIAARAVGEEGLSLTDETTHPGLVADLLLLLVVAHRGDPVDVTGLIDRAADLARQAGDPALIARVLIKRADLAQELGRPGFSEDTAEALVHLRELGDEGGMVHLLNNLGYAALEGGDTGAARRYFDEALALAERLRHAGHLLVLWLNIGAAAIVQGDFDDAQRLYTDALRVAGQTDDAGSILYGLLGLALCAVARGGDDRRAAMLHGAAQALLERLGQGFEAVEARLRDDNLVDLRQRMGAGAFEQAYGAGQQLSTGDAVDLAWSAGSGLPPTGGEETVVQAFPPV
jgi:predicted ATPase/class 3 adenylate cyclase